MVRTKVTHGKGGRMDRKEVKRIREDVRIGDGKTLKQERNKAMLWSVERDLSLGKIEYYSKLSNA